MATGNRPAASRELDGVRIWNEATGGGCLATFIQLRRPVVVIVTTNMQEGAAVYRDHAHFWEDEPVPLAEYEDLTTAIEAVSK